MGQWGNGAMGQWGNGAMGQWMQRESKSCIASLAHCPIASFRKGEPPERDEQVEPRAPEGVFGDDRHRFSVAR